MGCNTTNAVSFGSPGKNGTSAYIYVAYADDVVSGTPDVVTNFNYGTPLSTSKWIAFKNSNVQISNPVETNFENLWVKFQGAGVDILVGKTLFVSTEGNDNTAVPYSISNHYATIIAALNDAVSGDMIYVFPGDYTLSNNGLGVVINNINLYLSENTNIDCSTDPFVLTNSSILGNGYLFQPSMLGTYGPLLIQGDGDVIIELNQLESVGSIPAIEITSGEMNLTLDINNLTNGDILQYSPTVINFNGKFNNISGSIIQLQGDNTRSANTTILNIDKIDSSEITVNVSQIELYLNIVKGNDTRISITGQSNLPFHINANLSNTTKTGININSSGGTAGTNTNIIKGNITIDGGYKAIRILGNGTDTYDISGVFKNTNTDLNILEIGDVGATGPYSQNFKTIISGESYGYIGINTDPSTNPINLQLKDLKIITNTTNCLVNELGPVATDVQILNVFSNIVSEPISINETISTILTDSNLF